MIEDFGTLAALTGSTNAIWRSSTYAAVAELAGDVLELPVSSIPGREEHRMVMYSLDRRTQSPAALALQHNLAGGSVISRKTFAAGKAPLSTLIAVVSDHWVALTVARTAARLDQRGVTFRYKDYRRAGAPPAVRASGDFRTSRAPGTLHESRRS